MKNIVDYSTEELIRGINICFDNVADLFNDAELLYENERYPRAYSLYQLSSEESSKALGIINLLVSKAAGGHFTDEYKEGFNKFFTNHDTKIKFSVNTDLNYLKFAKKVGLPVVRNEKSITDELKNTQQLDKLKQDGFYVSTAHNKFKAPNEVITKDKCSKFRDVILERINKEKSTFSYFKQNFSFMVEKFKSSYSKQ